MKEKNILVTGANGFLGRAILSLLQASGISVRATDLGVASGATNNSVVNIIKQNIEIYNACKKNNVKLSMPFFFITKIVSRIKQFCVRPTI